MTNAIGWVGADCLAWSGNISPTDILQCVPDTMPVDTCVSGQAMLAAGYGSLTAAAGWAPKQGLSDHMRCWYLMQPLGVVRCCTHMVRTRA